MSTELKKTIIMLLAKYRNCEIANKLDCSDEYVRQIRVQQQISAPANIRKPNEQQIEKINKIREMITEGRNPIYMAHSLGLKRSSQVISFARKWNIKWPDFRKALQKVSKADLQAHINGGGTFKTAAKKFGVHYITILKTSKRYGIKSVNAPNRSLDERIKSSLEKKILDLFAKTANKAHVCRMLKISYRCCLKVLNNNQIPHKRFDRHK